MKNFLLIDDHEVIRTGIKYALLDSYRPCEIFEAFDQESAVTQIKAREYELIIMDVQMPDTNSLGLMDYIKTTREGAKVLIFSMSAEKMYARKFLKAGAKGYISKSAGLPELRKAIDLILQGRKYISEELAAQWAVDFGKEDEDNPFENLSTREFEIALLLTTGKTVTQIASLLNINISTVGTHKGRIFEKLGVQNLIELVELAKLYEVQ
ncbi:MAG TPA: response regulator transcription factor [Puia sp.]|nr:response regulator transcription factor [Puia sp.]